MKEHLIGYVINEQGKWWTGLNLTNHSYNPTSVLLDYYNPTGYKLKSEEIALQANGQKAFTVDIPYRGWIRGISDDNLTCNLFVGTFDAATNSKNPPAIIGVEKRDVIIRNVVNLNKGVVRISDAEFVQDMAVKNHYLTNDFWGVVQLISRWIAYKYSNRLALRLSIADASTQYGNDSGHPSTTHSVGMGCDFDYYTFGATNHTQSIVPGEPTIKIWNDDGTLDLTKFDAIRTMELIVKLREIYPNAMIMPYIGFKDALELAAYQVYGNEMRLRFQQFEMVNYDGTTHMNHDIHLHCNIKDKTGVFVINKDKVL